MASAFNRITVMSGSKLKQSILGNKDGGTKRLVARVVSSVNQKQVKIQSNIQQAGICCDVFRVR
jgi:hypothetical protein